MTGVDGKSEWRRGVDGFLDDAASVQQARADEMLRNVSLAGNSGTCAPVPGAYDIFGGHEPQRSPVELSLPPISVDRGAIKYHGPPVPPSKARAAWNAWGPRMKAVAARNRVKRSIARGRAFRKRVADTKAVWRGEKDAYSDAEIEKLTEDLW